MGTRIPVDFVEVLFELNLAGDSEKMFTSYGVQMVPGSQLSLALAQTFADAYQAHLLGLSGSGYSLTGVYLNGGPDDTGPQASWNGSYLTPTTDPATPSNTAVLLQKRTGLRGRRNRGRMYIPGPPDGLLDARGQINAFELVTYQQSAANFHAAIEAFGGVVDAMLFHTTGPAEPGVPPTKITSLTVASVAATQRRRMRP
jgi:hypothetical protein